MDTLAKHPARDKEDYIYALAQVFARFEEIPAEEGALFDVWLGELKIAQRHHARLWKIMRGLAEDARYEERIERLGQRGLGDNLLLDAMALAMVDGILMDEEVDALRELARSLGLSYLHFHIYLDLVHSAYQASHLSCAEPLFEHNIENALQLLCANKVPLLAHTRLCTCSEHYNQELKQRWHTLRTLPPQAS